MQYIINLFSLFVVITLTNAFNIAIAQNNPETLAIYYFTGSYGTSYDYVTSVHQAVESGFVQSNRFTIVERDRFDQLSEENQFREINTQDAVRIGNNIGANFVVLGHVSGVTTGSERKQALLSNSTYLEYNANVSFSLKIVDVESSQIIISESLGITEDSRDSHGVALGKVFQSVSNLTRKFINKNFPQEFPLMEVVEKDQKRNAIKAVKFWAGSDHGIRPGDVLVAVFRKELINPNTKEVVFDNQMLADIVITEVNGSTISTGEVQSWRRNGPELQAAIQENPDDVIFIFQGERKKYY